jgi:hypothetical protein
MDLLSLASGVVRTVIGGAIAWHASAVSLRAKTERELRRTAGDGIIPTLEELLRLVRHWDTSGDSAHWHQATERALNAIESQSHLLPPAWRHLRRSVRAAISEATGVFGFADRTPHDSSITVPQRCPVWADNAEEYLCHALESLRTWRDAVPQRRNHVPPLLDFDTLLRRREELSGQVPARTGVRVAGRVRDVLPLRSRLG